MTLSGLIKKAGELREDYFTGRGLIIRLDNQLYPTTIPFENHPLSLSTRLAIDIGEQAPDQFGLGVGLRWRLY